MQEHFKQVVSFRCCDNEHFIDSDLFWDTHYWEIRAPTLLKHLFDEKTGEKKEEAFEPNLERKTEKSDAELIFLAALSGEHPEYLPVIEALVSYDYVEKNVDLVVEILECIFLFGSEPNPQQMLYTLPPCTPEEWEKYKRDLVRILKPKLSERVMEAIAIHHNPAAPPGSETFKWKDDLLKYIQASV